MRVTPLIGHGHHSHWYEDCMMRNTLVWIPVAQMNKIMNAGLAMLGGVVVMPACVQAYDIMESRTRKTSAHFATMARSMANVRGDDLFSPYGVNQVNSFRAEPVGRRLPDVIPSMLPNEFILGYVWRDLRIEGAVSKEQRLRTKGMCFGVAKPFLLSSGSLSFGSSSNLSFKIRHGRQKRIEQIDPKEGVKRSTIATIYRYPSGRNQWQTMLAFGRSGKKADGSVSKAYLIESLFQLRRVHTFFGRAERATADELFDEREAPHGKNFTANRFTLGYVYDMASTDPIKLTFGGLITRRSIPLEQRQLMGKDRAVGKLFIRLTLEMK